MAPVRGCEDPCVPLVGLVTQNLDVTLEIDPQERALSPRGPSGGEAVDEQPPSVYCPRNRIDPCPPIDDDLTALPAIQWHDLNAVVGGNDRNV